MSRVSKFPEVKAKYSDRQSAESWNKHIKWLSERDAFRLKNTPYFSTFWTPDELLGSEKPWAQFLCTTSAAAHRDRCDEKRSDPRIMHQFSSLSPAGGVSSNLSNSQSTGDDSESNFSAEENSRFNADVVHAQSRKRRSRHDITDKDVEFILEKIYAYEKKLYYDCRKRQKFLPKREKALELGEEAVERRSKSTAAHVQSSSSDEGGPKPLASIAVMASQKVNYGDALRAGEGEATAQFALQGKRIPRRGEVGLTSEEITQYEDLGYVMSGSRHAKMTAVRIRKENQILSAQDNHEVALQKLQDNIEKEHEIVANFKQVLSDAQGR